MNKELLAKHVQQFMSDLKDRPNDFRNQLEERLSFTRYYQEFTADRIKIMSEEEIYQYISKLWAMLIWGNKHYLVDRIIEENGLDNVRNHLAILIWGGQDIAIRWDDFRKNIRGMGPAMISEILCKTHPEDYAIWNRRTYVGLRYLDVPNLPRHDYQVNGKFYKELCNIEKQILAELISAGFQDRTLLAVDYFVWEQLQVVENLTEIFDKKPEKESSLEKVEQKGSSFVHDDIRDKLSDIGQWLGFTSRTEKKIADGAQVDTVWEATIGNMGRVIYAFEVQTGGSIDSLIVNLLRSLNNPAVQGIVAVSDRKQLEQIRKEAASVPGLRDKLKYWDYENVLKAHDNLEFVYTSINELGLVPLSFI